MQDSKRPLSKSEALEEYVRLVGILDDELVFEKPGAVEALLGHPVGPLAAHQNAYAAARAALDTELVEAVAAARAAGVPWQTLTDRRGWLSHNDLHGILERAKKPSVDNVGLNWPQRVALRTVTRDIQMLLDSDPAEAQRLARSARTFLRRWFYQVPGTPPAETLKEIASMYRPDLLGAWKVARVQLKKDINELSKLVTP
jgi:hypothetical protein